MIYVSHIIESVAQEASGVSYSVPKIVSEVDKTEVMNIELCSIDQNSKLYKHFDVSHKKFNYDNNILAPKKLRGSKLLRQYLTRSQIDVQHYHGLWRPINLYPKYVKNRNMYSKVVVSPRGMLSDYTFRKNKIAKSVFWTLAQKQALQAADCIHVTSKAEFEEVRRRGLTAPIAIIPNGVDLDLKERRKFDERDNTVLYLGRIDPKKNLKELIKEWLLVENNKSWKLIIAGPLDNDYARSLQKIVTDLNCTNIIFMDGLYGEAKKEAYSRAKIFILPTINENFGLVVAEALSHGTPVITTTGAPWRGLTQNDCGWWIDLNYTSLRETITKVIEIDKWRFECMSINAKALAETEYGWPEISKKFILLYNWLCFNSNKPDWIHVETL